MDRKALAFGSFMVGLCIGFLVVSLIHTSTRTQAFQGSTLRGSQASGVSFGAREPEIFPLAVRLEGSTLTNPVQPLDGIDCEKCGIKADLFTYAGGPFRCVDCLIVSTPHTINLELKGAALNTVNMLRLVQAISKNLIPEQKESKKPVIIALNINTNDPVTWVSLEGLK